MILPDWHPPNLEECIEFLYEMSEVAGQIGLVLYNPPHAKKVLSPQEWSKLKLAVPALVGAKVYDNDRSIAWYQSMLENTSGISIFIPGHNLATGISLGGHGAYSNMACLNSFAAQAWYDQMIKDMPSTLELEGRILQFMHNHIMPLMVEEHYTGFACDRLLALIGGWADVGSSVCWPYRSISLDRVTPIRAIARRMIPEFFEW